MQSRAAAEGTPLRCLSMSSQEPGTAPHSEPATPEARKLAISMAAMDAVELLAKARCDRDWDALGHDGWEEYVIEALGGADEPLEPAEVWRAIIGVVSSESAGAALGEWWSREAIRMSLRRSRASRGAAWDQALADEADGGAAERG